MRRVGPPAVRALAALACTPSSSSFPSVAAVNKLASAFQWRAPSIIRNGCHSTLLFLPPLSHAVARCRTLSPVLMA